MAAVHDTARQDSQIALGLIELATLPNQNGDATQDVLAPEAAALSGFLAGICDCPDPATAGTVVHLLVTTRGPLAEATTGFTALPMLGRLAERHAVVHAGFGLGRTAAQTESLARAALARARRLGEVAGVVHLPDRADPNFLVLQASTPPDRPEGPDLAILAQRTGLSVPTLQRLRAVGDSVGPKRLTTRDIARHLDIQLRSARRLIRRLELAGLAERIGNQPPGNSGRPLTLYRVTL